MAMLSTAGCYLFVCIWYLSVSTPICGTNIAGRMGGVKYKPFDTGLLYNILTVDENSCHTVCIQHPACVMSLYRQADLSCCGYRTNYTTDVELEEGTKAWQIKYRGCSQLRSCLNGGWCSESEDGSKCNCPNTTLGDHCELVNVLTLPDIHPYMQCNASSTLSSLGSCDNIYDDSLITQSYGNDWTSDWEGAGAWIEITFPKEVGIDHIQLWHRCDIVDQAKLVKIDFSDESSFEIEGPCDGGDDWQYCEELVGFQEFALTPPRIATWVKLTVLETCITSYKCLGFREIKCFGQFPEVNA